MIKVNDWVQACESAHCVQVKFTHDGHVFIRSSDRAATLWFTRDEWDAFANGVKAGEFDNLA